MFRVQGIGVHAVAEVKQGFGGGALGEFEEGRAFGCLVCILDSLVVEVSNNCAGIEVDKIISHFRHDSLMV